MMYLLNDPVSDEEARRVLAYVLQRAETDPSFRSALLSTPREALEAEFAIQLPDSFNIRFVGNDGADLTVVLPDVASDLPPARTSGTRARLDAPSGDRLSGDDLVAVSGGGEPPSNVETVLRTLGSAGLTSDSTPRH